MDYLHLESIVSKPRLDRYAKATHASKMEAKRLYRINLRASQAFYPLLSIFEVSLRNAVYNAIADYFDDSDWILNQRRGFMSDPLLSRSKFHLRGKVNASIKKLRQQQKEIYAARILADQSLGFWIALFDAHHHRLLKGATMRTFPHKPAGLKRQQVRLRLAWIRDFRNRIYHNEPICFHQNRIDFREAQKVHNAIYEVLGWLDADLPDYASYFDAIEGKIGSYGQREAVVETERLAHP